MRLSTILALLPAITMALAAPAEFHGHERRSDIVKLNTAKVEKLLEKGISAKQSGVETHRHKARIVPAFAEEKLSELGVTEEDVKDATEIVKGGFSIKKRDIS